MILFKHNTIKKEQIDEKINQINFDASKNKNKKYKVEAVSNNRVYTNESKSYLLEFYYNTMITKLIGYVILLINNPLFLT